MTEQQIEICKAIADVKAAIKRCRDCGMVVLSLGYNSDWAHPITDIEYDEAQGKPALVFGCNDEVGIEIDYIEDGY